MGDELIEKAIAILQEESFMTDGSILNPVSLIQRRLLLDYSAARTLLALIKDTGLVVDTGENIVLLNQKDSLR